MQLLQVIRNLIVAAALAHGVDSQTMLNLASCESTFRPSIVNTSSGARGLFQLLSPGELDIFYAKGFTDWTDPSQQSNFVAEELIAGKWRAWSQCYSTKKGIL